MKNARKPRSDSVQAQVNLASSAAQSLQWPPEVSLPANDRDREVALAAYQRIISCRPLEYWRPADFIMAGDLAICIAWRDRLQRDIDRDGPTVLGGKAGNTPVKHPAMQALEHYRSSVIQLSRALGLTGAQGLDAAPKTIAAEAARQAAAGFTYTVAADDACAEVIDYNQLRM